MQDLYQVGGVLSLAYLTIKFGANDLVSVSIS